MQKIAVQFALWLLKRPLSMECRTLLINAILDRLSAIPLRDIITLSENGSLVINGKELDMEELKIIYQSAIALRNNRVFNLIQDQVLHNALTFGLNSSVTLEMLYTSKAAVWWGQEENKLLKLITEIPDQSV